MPDEPRGRLGTALLVLSVLTGAVTHGWNTFRYPLYLTDEGIYMEQAWSVLREGQLSPYTYFYDHAPAGWLLIESAGGRVELKQREDMPNKFSIVASNGTLDLTITQ